MDRYPIDAWLVLLPKAFSSCDVLRLEEICMQHLGGFQKRQTGKHISICQRNPKGLLTTTSRALPDLSHIVDICMDTRMQVARV